jgi:hypothetical protein
VLIPAFLWLACGACAAPCVVPVILSVSSLVVLWGCYPGLLHPSLTPAAFPLARAPGCVYPCVLMHVSCARCLHSD